MNVNRRLVLLGVMLVVLSMTMATQYATTKVGYTYSIVHPSNADIRFIGCDNSSDNIRVLRTASGTNASGSLDLEIRLGNWSENYNKTYTMAFGIVNEEPFAVNITNAWVENSVGADYMKVWLHGRSSWKATDDPTSVKIWDSDDDSRDQGYTNFSSIWTLAAGNKNTWDMNGTECSTPWDETAYVRYNVDGSNPADEKAWAESGNSDFVWVQISIDIPDGAATAASVTGTIYLNFEATTTS